MLALRAILIHGPNGMMGVEEEGEAEGEGVPTSPFPSSLYYS